MSKLPEAAIQDVLRYFVREPLALDTVEGIARWRLLNERLQRGVEETRVAVEWLSDQGFLERVAVSGCEPLFRLVADKRPEAEELLSQRKASRFDPWP